jgi:hypothetical protein
VGLALGLLYLCLSQLLVLSLGFLNGNFLGVGGWLKMKWNVGCFILMIILINPKVIPRAYCGTALGRLRTPAGFSGSCLRSFSASRQGARCCRDPYFCFL